MTPEHEQPDHLSQAQFRAQERTYLAHELHDSLAQTLASVRYYIRNLDHAIQGGDECEIFELLETVENNVEIANKELRELINRFRGPMEEEDLIPALENITLKFKAETAINAVFQNRLSDIECSQLVTAQVVRIVQEALANIRKHADATMVRVMVHQESESIHLLVEDDGIGFDQKKVAADCANHFGLKTMAERATRTNGSFNIDSIPGEGTRVQLTFPMEQHES